jgi:hypothetical protein
MTVPRHRPSAPRDTPQLSGDNVLVLVGVLEGA